MAKKKTKTTKAKPQGSRRPSTRRATPASAMRPTPAATSTPTPMLPAAPVVRLRPAARMRRATASPAQRRGADLTRYLRIHTKHPYADRGIRAIHKLALEVAHLGRLELGASAPVAEN